MVTVSRRPKIYIAIAAVLSTLLIIYGIRESSQRYFLLEEGDGPIILFWTFYFNGESMLIEDTSSSRELMELCEFEAHERPCRFTRDKQYFEVADAVMFHAPDLTYMLSTFPDHANERQVFIYVNKESPTTKTVYAKIPPNYFNWTLTYRLDSDFPETYNFFEEDLFTRDERLIMRRKDPQNLVAAFISNCHDYQSQRLDDLQRLSDYIGGNRVHIYGRCGDQEKCKKSPGSIHGVEETECAELLRSYYFIASFENSFCADYVTEKLYRAFNYDAVPIVNNIRVDYSNFAPPNSFIQMFDFNSIPDLGEYLLSLEANETQYLQYHKWKNMSLTERNAPAYTKYRPHGYNESGVCKMCKALQNPFEPKFYHDVNLWWNQNNSEKESKVCTIPRQLQSCGLWKVAVLLESSIMVACVLTYYFRQKIAQFFKTYEYGVRGTEIAKFWLDRKLDT